MRRVVYKCLFGHSELFNDFEYERGDVDFVCFTDDPDLRSSFWEIKLVPRKLLDPARASKRIKALPHLFLPQYDWSLYIDNTVDLKATPGWLFEEFLAPAKSPLVCFRHHERNCVYDEARVVLSLDFDTPERVNAQMSLYRFLGYPAGNGLAVGAYLLRKHHDPVLRPVMNLWQDQILSGSKRDQLSLLPVCWSEGFNPEYLPGQFNSGELLRWPVVKHGLRLPRDFDEALYLQLNPDLGDVNIDLRKHYLLHGQNEKRRYRNLDLADITDSPLRVLRRFRRLFIPPPRLIEAATSV
jgi:Protein of unknown function (DUF616)